MKNIPTYQELEKEIKELKSNFKLSPSSREENAEFNKAEENIINAINIIERSP